MKKRIQELIMNKRYGFPRNCRIHNNSNIFKVRCEGYNTISKGSIVVNSKLGLLSNVNIESVVNNTSIGRYCSLGPRLKIITGQHPTSKFVSINPVFYSLRKQSGFSFSDKQLFEEFKYADEKNKISVVIENDVWIGSDVKIIEGVTIHNGAIVAAGAVVTKDVPPYAIVGGIPAKLIRYRFSQNEIKELEEIGWWDWPFEKVKRNWHLFSDINEFLKTQEIDNDQSLEQNI